MRIVCTPCPAACFSLLREGLTRGGATINKMKTIDIELLREWIAYNPLTGALTWAKQRGSRGVIGARCESSHKQGYLCIKFNGQRYQAHRIAFALHHGRWPTNQIDHINRAKDDNRICNLREATSSENSCNTPISNRNTSGHTGVQWHKGHQKWYAKVIRNGVAHRKLFTSLDEATAWASEKRRELHGAFAA
jgi:hypothetical protein